MTIDDPTLVAWLDGELAPTDAAAVAHAVETDPAVAARVATLDRARGALEALPGGAMTPADRSRLVQALLRPPRRAWRGWAAVVVVGAAVAVSAGRWQAPADSVWHPVEVTSDPGPTPGLSMATGGGTHTPGVVAFLEAAPAREGSQSPLSRLARQRAVREPVERVALAQPEAISLAATRLVVEIRHGIATCRLTQEFQNNTDTVLEGTYRLPLEPDAEVNGFAVWEGGERLVGEIVPIERARQVYAAERELAENEIRARRAARDPGLLTRDARRHCTIQVFPIQPRELKRIDVAYSLPVPWRAGRFHFGFSLAPARAYANVGTTQIDVDVSDALGLGALEAAGSSIVALGPDRARVRYDRAGAAAEDFELSWRPTRDGVAIAAHRAQGPDELGEGFFVLRVVPDVGPLGRALADTPCDLAVLVDVTASIVADKRTLAIRAARALLASAAPADRVRLLAFGARLHDCSGGWCPAGRDHDTRALAALESVSPAGGPALAPVLAAALGTLDATRRARVVLVSDGVARDAPGVIAQSVSASLPALARLDTVGLGYDDDEPTLAAIATAGQGAHVVAGGGSPTRAEARELGTRPEQVGRLDLGRFAVFSQPADPLFEPAFLHAGRPGLAAPSLVVRAGAVALSAIHADWDQGLWVDGSALVFGRYRGGGEARLALTGTVGTTPWTHELDVTLPDTEPDNRMVAAFWARREVAALERTTGGAPVEAARARIVELAMAYQFVSSETALLALTDSMRARHGLAGERVGVDELYKFSEGVPEPETVLLLVVAAMVLWVARGYGRA